MLRKFKRSTGNECDSAHVRHSIFSSYFLIWLLSSTSAASASASLNPLTLAYSRQSDIEKKFRLFKRRRSGIACLTFLSRSQSDALSYHWISLINGGANDEGEYDYDYDDDVDDDEESDVDELENDEIISTDESTNIKTDNAGDIVAYDEPLMPSPYINMMASVFVMLLSRKYDLFDPKLVKIARFCFISYLVCLQIFLVYTRIRTKLRNDRTPIEVSNPLSSMLQTKLLGSGDTNDNGNNMIKSLASSFLSSKTTICEYDMKQARNMQSGLIFNMAFMWFLHFKMNQVQPLFIQSLTGFVSMIYSPLFQVYALNRNLERPFRSGPVAKTDEESEPNTGDELAAGNELLAKVEDKDEDDEESIEEDPEIIDED